MHCLGYGLDWLFLHLTGTQCCCLLIIGQVIRRFLNWQISHLSSCLLARGLGDVLARWTSNRGVPHGGLLKLLDVQALKLLPVQGRGDLLPWLQQYALSAWQFCLKLKIYGHLSLFLLPLRLQDLPLLDDVLHWRLGVEV